MDSIHNCRLVTLSTDGYFLVAPATLYLNQRPFTLSLSRPLNLVPFQVRALRCVRLTTRHPLRVITLAHSIAHRWFFAFAIAHFQLQHQSQHPITE
jgi:hypothetical protein